ncbi:hypothetical protein RRG08_028757 [Elysia crispata]|uniref:Uncharacterized protein n=1 Tax=Elysia crispata TaxID=231223 RepID=A0AAE0ZLY6_9GAST|nr:hypothetical protein RRG08_028757 [Elysia crispata]
MRSVQSLATHDSPDKGQHCMDVSRTYLNGSVLSASTNLPPLADLVTPSASTIFAMPPAPDVSTTPPAPIVSTTPPAPIVLATPPASTVSTTPPALSNPQDLFNSLVEDYFQFLGTIKCNEKLSRV